MAQARGPQGLGGWYPVFTIEVKFHVLNLLQCYACQLERLRHTNLGSEGWLKRLIVSLPCASVKTTPRPPSRTSVCALVCLVLQVYVMWCSLT